MDGAVVFDPEFDFRTDAGGGDPDATSPTLRAYHRLLWSKPLPGGAPFDLVDTQPGEYLYHRSGLGEFFLSSDAAVATWSTWMRMEHIVGQVPEQDVEEFDRITYQMGGMMLFPSNKVGGARTINSERGCNARIVDRLDLTVECIRRHYLSQDSPLADTLARYREFFALFDDFAGYVDFFLLQDLVEPDGSGVKFHLPFNGFPGTPLPATVEQYEVYRARAIAFVQARNARMAADVAAR